MSACCQLLVIPPHNKVSLRPSVCPSVRPSVLHPVSALSAPTVLVGPISYLYILWSNFRRCVACDTFCKIKEFEFFAIFSCGQAALWMVQSVCVCLSDHPSICPSVRLPARLSVTHFWLCSHCHIIMKFSGVITNDRSEVDAKGLGQRSKGKVTEVNTQLSRFRTVTPVCIHIWWWNDAQSLMLLRRGALLF